MKITKRQLRRIIREALEQVDWDNPQGSWDSNDQENWENEQDWAREDSEILDPLELKWFYDWIEGDNATEVEPDVWIEQSTQHRIKFTFKELQEFFKETYVPLGIPDHIVESMKRSSGGYRSGMIYVEETPWGVLVRDENKNPIRSGDMVMALIEDDTIDFFHGFDDEKSFQRMMAKHEEGIQGGLENWDPDVFEDIYNVDMLRVAQMFSDLHSTNIIYLEPGELER
jgi:hypothetical protein